MSPEARSKAEILSHALLDIFATDGKCNRLKSACFICGRESSDRWKSRPGIGGLCVFARTINNVEVPVCTICESVFSRIDNTEYSDEQPYLTVEDAPPIDVARWLAKRLTQLSNKRGAPFVVEDPA